MKVSAFAILFFFYAMLSAGVIKKSKTKVSFGSFGTLTTETTVQLEGLKKRVETQKNFESDNMMGQMMGGLMGGTGQSGEIISLEKMQRIQLDHPNKRYTVTPIEKIDWQRYQGEEREERHPEEEEEQEESNVKIIRNGFKVTDTGERKKINRFDCRKYLITWVTEWQNTETGEKGKDSLASVVWTTRADKALEAALAEEKKFDKLYMEKIGVPVDEMQSEMLGTQWLRMFRAMNRGQQAPEVADQALFKEMAKIKGYPVVTDGKFFVRTNKKQVAEAEPEPEEEKPDITDVGGLFGGFVKKALEKKLKGKKKAPKKSGSNLAFSFYNELIDLRTGAVDKVAFEIPKGYKEVKK